MIHRTTRTWYSHKSTISLYVNTTHIVYHTSVVEATKQICYYLRLSAMPLGHLDRGCFIFYALLSDTTLWNGHPGGYIDIEGRRDREASVECLVDSDQIYKQGAVSADDYIQD